MARELDSVSSWSSVPSATSVGTEIVDVRRPAASPPCHHESAASPWAEITAAEACSASG